MDLGQQIAEERAEAQRIAAVNAGATLEDAERTYQEAILQTQIEFAQQRLALFSGELSQEQELAKLQLENFIADAQQKLAQARTTTESETPFLQQALGVDEANYQAIKDPDCLEKGIVLRIIDDPTEEEIKDAILKAILPRTSTSCDNNCQERGWISGWREKDKDREFPTCCRDDFFEKP